MSDDSPSGSPSTLAGNAAERPRDPAGDSLIDRFLSLIGLRQGSIREDLNDALAENSPGADFSPQERAMLRNVLALRTRRVDDVMVPRADIVAAPLDTPLGDLLRLFRTAGHSRLPVFAETLDDPRGMVHIRDFLDFVADRAETARGTRRRKIPQGMPDLGKVDLSIPLSAAKILRPVLFVPPSMPALDLLVKMQTLRTHMALVIDEYGGTDGLVSIEDLVEIVVGDIEDEHDEDEAPGLSRTADGSWIADARTSLEDASQELSVDLMAGDLAEDVDTLGGLIATLAGRVPARGEVIAHPLGLEFTVLDADPRRIKRLRITATPATGSEEAGAPKALPPPPPALPPPASAPGEGRSEA